MGWLDPDQQQEARFKEGAAVWNAWRASNPDAAISLNRAYLSGANLAGVDLSGAQLRMASMGKCSLVGAKLDGACLDDARLEEADLTDASLSRASLQGHTSARLSSTGHPSALRSSGAENPPHFALAQDDRGAARDPLHGGEVEEVIPDLLFRQLIRASMIEPGQLRDGVDVGLDRAVGIAVQLEVVDHALAEWCHGALSDRVERDEISLRRVSQSHGKNTGATMRRCYPPQAD